MRDPLSEMWSGTDGDHRGPACRAPERSGAGKPVRTACHLRFVVSRPRGRGQGTKSLEVVAGGIPVFGQVDVPDRGPGTAARVPR